MKSPKKFPARSFAITALLVVAIATLSSLGAANPSPTPTGTPLKRVLPLRSPATSATPVSRPNQRPTIQSSPGASPQPEKASMAPTPAPAMSPQKVLKTNGPKPPTFSGHNALRMPTKNSLKKVTPLSAQEKLQALDGKSTVTTFKIGPEQPRQRGCALYFLRPIAAGAVDQIDFPSSLTDQKSRLLVEVSGSDLLLESIKAGKEFTGQILLFDLEVIRQGLKTGATFTITGPGGLTQSVPVTGEAQHLLFVLNIADAGAASFEISCDTEWAFQSCEVTLAK